MTQQEHLQLIRARCVELLEIAEKRTAGRWKTGRDNSDKHLVYGLAGRLIHAKQGEQNINVANAAFVASCAGAAEAGWLATIAAIDGIIDPESSQTTHDWSLMHNIFTVKQIIASWPLELLQQ